ncbi:MAG: CDP-alcohol phosphatidyltransferase family protein [Candidatus Acidiferrales bacterium]
MGRDRYENGSAESKGVIPGLKKARGIAQPAGSSPSITDIPYRKVSIYLSVPLAKLSVTPNQITVVWILLGLAGDVGLGFSQYWVRVTAAAIFQLSYILDYVDGEVARLQGRTSKRGFFLDLSGHCLIKTGIFLGVGYRIVASTGRLEYLILAFLACVSVSNLSSLYTFASYAGVSAWKKPDSHDTAPPPRASTLRRLLGLFGILFESPGIYALVFVAAVLERTEWLLLFYGICGPLWFVFRTHEYRYE